MVFFFEDNLSSHSRNGFENRLRDISPPGSVGLSPKQGGGDNNKRRVAADDGYATNEIITPKLLVSIENTVRTRSTGNNTIIDFEHIFFFFCTNES